MLRYSQLVYNNGEGMIKGHTIPQDEIAKILQLRLSAIQKKNPAFSMRGLARKLDVNSGVLSLIMNGKRNISEDFALRLADALELSQKERALFLSYFEFKKSLKKDLEAREVSGELLAKLPEWHHFAILSIVKLDNFTVSAESVSARLGITPDEAESALSFLLEQGLLTKDATTYQRTASFLKTPDNIPNDYLKDAQANNLRMGIDSIYRDDVELRDFTAMTMAIDTAKLPQAKELIRKFQKDISLMLEHGEKKEVYKMVVGVYPLTRSE